LEEKERELSSKLEDVQTVQSSVVESHPLSNAHSTSQAQTRMTDPTDPMFDHPTPANSTPSARENGFVGDGSGMSFLRFIFSQPKWHRYKQQIVQQLAQRPQIPELSISSNPEPPLEEASRLLTN
jgi:hypothetical protein